jgi:hypothetical protein
MLHTHNGISTHINHTSQLPNAQRVAVTCSNPPTLATLPLQSSFLQIPVHHSVQVPCIAHSIPRRPRDSPATSTEPLCSVPTHHALSMLILVSCQSMSLEPGLRPCICAP